MIGKKINQLATELAPVSTDLTIIGDPISGVSKKITLAQLGAIFSGAVSFYTDLASFPATGDINVIYCAKDTQKLYLWSGSAYTEVFPSQALLDTYQLRSEKGNANGYASLDSGGKVPISQLPSSIMEYKGTWNASTNTPTLANGTGDTGDVYICNVAGTVDFGAGAITFAVGDYVIYSGTIWQRSSGAVGTVTSVAASITGDSVTISGSPVTTSGTLAFAFAGTGAQYIKGDGTLATFPNTIDQAKNLITEVYNSTGATLTKGTVVYINGGQGNLPTVTKALASGDSTSAQTYGIVQADITNNNNGFVVVAGRLADIDTSAFSVGTQLYLSSTTAGAYTSTKQYAPAHLVYVGIIVRSHPTQGIIEVKIQNGYELDELHDVAAQTPTNNDGLFWEASTSLWKNKSIATILGGTPVTGSGNVNTIPKFTANSVLGNSVIEDDGTFVSMRGLKINAVGGVGETINFQQGTGITAAGLGYSTIGAASTTGFVFYIDQNTTSRSFILDTSTITSATQLTYSLPASSGTLALVSQLTGGTVTSVGLSVPTGFAVSGSPVTSSGTLALAFDTGYSLPTIVKQNNWDTAYNTRIVTASSPLSFISNTISISQSSGSTDGYLSSTDWTTFNNKQNALTNPVTGTGTTNYLPKFTGTSTIGNSAITDDGTTVTLVSRALSGTSATFSSGLIVSNTSDVYPEFKTSAADADAFLGFSNTGDGNNAWGVGRRNTGEFWITNFTGNFNSGTRTTVLSLASTGAATFSSSIAATSGTFYLGDGINGTYFLGGSGNTARQLKFSTSTTTNVGDTHIIDAQSGTGVIQFATTSSVKMTLSNSGNLGLGVTPSAGLATANYRLFEIGLDGGGSLYSGSNQTLYGTNISWVGGTPNYVRTGSAPTLYNQSNGAHSWSTAPTGTAGNAISFTQAMTLDASGRLGIGTTSPSSKLMVSGTGDLSYIYNSGASTTDANFYVYSATKDHFMIRNSGNVGIGTASPSALLHLGSSGSAAQLWLQRTDGYNPVKLIGGTLGDGNGFKITMNTTDAFAITSGGNVGIGTTSISSSISGSAKVLAIVDNTTANVGSVRVFGGGTTTSLELYGAGGEVGLFGSTAHPMTFSTNGSERMRITSGGDVLIGATSGSSHIITKAVSVGTSPILQIYGNNSGANFFNCDGNSSSSANTGMRIGQVGATGRSINAGGTVNASGADYAEYMTKAITENIAKGDIAGVDANGLLTNIYADAISFVVKSTDPSYVGGDKWGADLKGAELETARQKVDRVAFSGQVPCNVLNAKVGDYIIPINVNGKIKGEAVTNPTFEQYQISVGKVWKIMEDGRAWIAIKIG